MTDYYCEKCEFFEDKSTDKFIDGYCKKYNQSLNFYDWWEKCDKCIIETLQAENAALRERLEKAVELPCKIGDEVYEVHGKCDGKNCPYNGDYGQWRCIYGGKRNCNSFITVNKFCYSDIPRVGKTIFVTKKAAEARLAELNGGSND